MNTTTNKIYKKFADGEDVFLKNTFENAVVKITSEGTFVKIKGKEEFKANPESNLVADAILELTEISPKQYADF